MDIFVDPTSWPEALGNTVIMEPLGKSLWIPSRKLSSSASMFHLSLERAHLVLFPLLFALEVFTQISETD